MKPVTYTGKVVDKKTGRGVAGAEIQLSRPPHKYAKSTLGDWAVMGPPERMGTFTTDRNGNFTATTRSGYATAAWAAAGDRSGKFGGADQNHPDSKPLPRRFEIEIAPFESYIVSP